MKHLTRWTAVGAMAILASACSTDPLALDRTSLSSAQLAAAFSSVPLEYSSMTSSFTGDTDGVASLWLPGPRMVGFSGGLMGGGLGDAYGGAMGPGRGFGHQGPFGGRFGGGLTCTGAFNAATGRFVCDPITHNGVTVSQTIAYTNAAGAVQQAFDTVTTNTVNVASTATGTVTFTRDSSNAGKGRGGPRHLGHFAGDTSTILTATTTVNNSSNRTVTGLASGSTSRTINGTSGGTESTTGTSSTGAFTASRSAADTTKGLVVPIATGKGTYPTAGTVIRVMKATVTYTGSAAVSTSRREVITYDGTATATVVITRDGTTQNCTMPLPHGRLTCS